MRIKVDAQFCGALDHVFAVDAAGKGFVLHFLSHAGDFNFGDLLARFHKRAGGEESGKFVAGKERLIQMRHAGNAGVLSVSEDRRAQLDGPALALQFADSDERMLFGRGVPLVVEVVEQAGGGVQVDKARALVPGEAESIGFYITAGCDADFHSNGVLAQAFALGPLGEQFPCLVAAISFLSLGSVHALRLYVLHTLVRVSSGIFGFDAVIFGLILTFYLTIMVHSLESSTYRGANDRGSTLLWHSAT